MLPKLIFTVFTFSINFDFDFILDRFISGSSIAFYKYILSFNVTFLDQPGNLTLKRNDEKSNFNDENIFNNKFNNIQEILFI